MIYAFFKEVGRTGLFLKQLLKTFFSTQQNFTPVLAQTTFVLTRSFATVAFAGVFVGAILVLQFNLMLARYDSQSLLGGLNTSAVIRQVGPLIISFLLAGKIGAYTAAELATMRVTEQIDAIECLGTNPMQYLIVPRFLGIVFSTLILLGIGLLISVAGSMVVAQVFCDINFLEYASSISKFLDPWTVIGGFFQSLVYGTIVALVACFKGYTASGGARGVGRAVTMAAVYTNLYIVIANFASSQCLEAIETVVKSILRTT